METQTAITEAEARELVEKIKKGSTDVQRDFALLLESEGWAAMKYRSCYVWWVNDMADHDDFTPNRDNLKRLMRIMRSDGTSEEEIIAATIRKGGNASVYREVREEGEYLGVAVVDHVRRHPKPSQRVVSFRVTPDEYSKFSDAARKAGCDSVNDWAELVIRTSAGA